MGVQFDEGNIPRNFGGQTVPKFAAFLISKGIVKDEAGANKVQIGMAVVFFALALYFAFSGGSTPSQVNPGPALPAAVDTGVVEEQ